MTPSAAPPPGTGSAAIPDTDLAHQREIVDAFFAASRNGDFDALVALLDPDVIARAEITEIDILADPARLCQIDLTVLNH